MLLDLAFATSATTASTLEGATRAMAGGGVPLDFDRSVLLQIVVFAVLIVVLKPLLFDPVLKVFALREERTEGARATARELQEKAGELLRKYEKELERVQQVAAEEREILRSETTKLEAEILREARDVTTRIAADGRKKIEAEVNSIRVAVGAESEKVAQMIVDRVIGQGAN
ncbi:MAG TPA: ATP synthase F0 subunit B [Polyangiaceae bacterium]